MNDRVDYLSDAERDLRLAAVEERYGPPMPRELTADDLMAELRQLRADMSGRSSEFQARAATENAAQIPKNGEESSLLRPRHAKRTEDADPDTPSVEIGWKSTQFGALAIGTATTILTALGAVVVARIENSPETVLLVVVDLLPWLLGLMAVYVACKTVERVVERVVRTRR